MTQPGTPGSQIPPSGVDDTILRPLADLERRVKLLEANAIGTNGIVVATGNSIRSANFDGNLSAPSAGTVGWALGGAADALIVATAVFKDAIIGNAALANPVDFGSHGQAILNFPLGTSGGTIVSQTITVPTGYSRAIVMATGHMSAIETNGATDYCNFTVLINGTGSAETLAMALPHQPAHVSNSSVRGLTGLSGGSITFAGWGYAQGAAWAAQAANVCTINAIAIFLR